VDAQADADRPGRKRLVSGACCRDRRGGVGEYVEEGVTLGVHLHASMAPEYVAEDSPVLSERVGVPLGPELVQQPRRPLDVREEESHRPA
jgi:hypothetical protein